MNKKFTKLIAAIALLVFMTPSLAVWGQDPQTITIVMSDQGWSDGTDIGSGTLKVKVNDVSTNTSFNYSSDKGEAQNAPAYYNNGTNVRFYCKKNGNGNGGSMTITPAANSNITITGVELTASSGYTKTTKYNVDNGSDQTLTWDGTTGTVSNISATTSFKFRNANQANNTDQLRITQIKITYTQPASGPTQLTAPTNFSATAGNGQATFSWTAVDHASNYTILAKNGDTWDNPTTLFDNVSLTNGQYVGTGLSNETTYVCKVRANGDGTNYSNSALSEATATFTPTAAQQYTVTIADGITGGTVGANPTTATEGTEISLTANPNSGYNFTSWNVYKTGEQGTTVTVTNNKFNMPAYNVTVSATFTAIPTYTVTYDCNGGDSGCPDNLPSVLTGTQITLAAAPTKTGNIFKGWSDGTTIYQAGASYTVNSNVTFTAQWFPGAMGTILFGNSAGHLNFNANTTSGDDNLGNTWNIDVQGTTNYAPNATYIQVGTKDNPASGITFTTTLSSSVIITDFSATFGGNGSTAGDITLKVGETVIGTGSLNETNDVTVENIIMAQGTTLTVTVTNIARGVKCYGISYTYTTSTDPIINAQPALSLGSTDTYNEFNYNVFNASSGVTLSASSTNDWISNINVTDTKVTFETTANTDPNNNRIGTITLSYTGAESKTITITQSKVDYATLPVIYEGGVNALPVGFTQNDLGSDYNSSAIMRFDNTGDWLVLKLNEAPLSLSYDIKINGTWGNNNVFDVQTSADGTTWTSLVSHTTMSGSVKTFTHIDLPTTVRYIKWVYTNRASGNVGMGNIRATTQYDIYGTCTAGSLSIANKTCTVYNGGLLNVSGSISGSTTANLIINDGGQLVTSNAVNATVQRSITGYSDATGFGNTDGWYFIASPASYDPYGTDMLSNTYDLFLYDEANVIWRNYEQTGNYNHFTMEPKKGYLYANSEDIDLSFAGQMPAYTTNVTVDLSYTEEADLKGFNLVGNPFTCNVSSFKLKNTNTNAISDLSAYYVVEGGTEIVSSTDPIKPGQGFIVQATGANQQLVFNYAAAKGETVTKPAFVRIEAGNEIFMDCAFVQIGQGNTLRKMKINENVAHVWLMQDGKDYAATTITQGQGEMPVNFRANENGTYTLTVNPENVEMNYLHLIDNLTGANVDLLTNPSYTFNAKVTDYESRFKLVFMANNEVGASTNEETFAFFSNGQLVIGNEGEATLQVIDMLGRIVSTETINGSSSVNFTAPAGVYVIRLINGENVKTQKMVVR